MFVTTSATFLISTGELLSSSSYDYDGPLQLACGGGPSQSQQQLAASQQQFYSTLQNSYAQTFAGQQAILSSLKSAWSPILSAGPGQYGFTPAEDSAMRSQVTQSTAGNYAQASRALNEGMAAKGGDAQITSGANAQLDASVAQAAAGQQSAENLGITQAGYAQGLQNFNAASSVLGGVANYMNPTGYISGANQAGSSAFGSATTNYNEAQAASPWNAVSGILGGALGVGLDAFTGGIGGSLASGIMGGGSGGIGSSLFNLGGGGAGNGPGSIPIQSSPLPNQI
jgi:hypothetical protein